MVGWNLRKEIERKSSHRHCEEESLCAHNDMYNIFSYSYVWNIAICACNYPLINSMYEWLEGEKEREREREMVSKRFHSLHTSTILPEQNNPSCEQNDQHIRCIGWGL